MGFVHETYSVLPNSLSKRTAYKPPCNTIRLRIFKDYNKNPPDLIKATYHLKKKGHKLN